MIIVVNVEWPTGSEEIEFEIDDDATDEQIHGAASDEFFNRCNFGWERKE